MGWYTAAAIPFSYILLSAVNVAISRMTRPFEPFHIFQLGLNLLLPFLLMRMLGGFAVTGAVILWSLVAPLAALLVSERREAIGWFVGYSAAGRSQRRNLLFVVRVSSRVAGDERSAVRAEHHGRLHRCRRADDLVLGAESGCQPRECPAV